MVTMVTLVMVTLHVMVTLVAMVTLEMVTLLVMVTWSMSLWDRFGDQSDLDQTDIYRSIQGYFPMTNFAEIKSKMADWWTFCIVFSHYLGILRMVARALI